MCALCSFLPSFPLLCFFCVLTTPLGLIRTLLRTFALFSDFSCFKCSLCSFLCSFRLSHLFHILIPPSWTFFGLSSDFLALYFLVFFCFFLRFIIVCPALFFTLYALFPCFSLLLLEFFFSVLFSFSLLSVYLLSYICVHGTSLFFRWRDCNPSAYSSIFPFFSLSLSLFFSLCNLFTLRSRSFYVFLRIPPFP
jgi:hypothetical protein